MNSNMWKDECRQIKTCKKISYASFSLEFSIHFETLTSFLTVRAGHFRTNYKCSLVTVSRAEYFLRKGQKLGCQWPLGTSVGSVRTKFIRPYLDSNLGPKCATDSKTQLYTTGFNQHTLLQNWISRCGREGGGVKNTKARTNSQIWGRERVPAASARGKISQNDWTNPRDKRVSLWHDGDKKRKQNTIVFQHFPIDERDPRWN